MFHHHKALLWDDLYSHTHPLPPLINLATTNPFSLLFLIGPICLQILYKQWPLIGCCRFTTRIALPLVHHWAAIMLRETGHLISPNEISNSWFSQLSLHDLVLVQGQPWDSPPACLPCLTLLHVRLFLAPSGNIPSTLLPWDVALFSSARKTLPKELQSHSLPLVKSLLKYHLSRKILSDFPI